MKSLQSFIKEETGFNNEIYRQKDWKVLAEKMAQGQLQIGVFEGHEFAWAQAERPDLKPLALAVNIFVYPVVHVVTQNKNPAKDFAGLQGYSLSVTALGQNNLRLFIDRESQACGKKTEAFFSSISAPANAEEALDDVVDGKVQATVVDRSSLTAYKERKPGRFNRLKVVAQSQPLSPPVVAYYTAKVDDSTLQRLKTGLLDAAKKEKGETLLTLFHLTGFVDVPADFEQVLAQMLKAYPPPAKTK
jgi:ABC-type phosphate/phosphonate transport system substrate-binding protein